MKRKLAETADAQIRMQPLTYRAERLSSMPPSLTERRGEPNGG
jgi:hypothetical protein